nr:MAG TPA: hypothetical protein [Caudoviricetes sp.]
MYAGLVALVENCISCIPVLFRISNCFKFENCDKSRSCPPFIFETTVLFKYNFNIFY